MPLHPAVFVAGLFVTKNRSVGLQRMCSKTFSCDILLNLSNYKTRKQKNYESRRIQ